MIKVENVNKYFNRFKKNQIHVINNTSLEMGKTGLVAILGESGSGKTTLLNAIGGLDKVNKGKIFVNGKKINSKFSSKTDKIRNLNIGYIFQKFLLIDEMTIFENVALVLKMQGIKDKKEIEKRVDYVLEKVGMETYKYRYPTMLSGGQRQRIAIARAIVKNPNVIIADEPTGNLDSKNSLEVMKIIKAISKEKLVILVTHEKDLANFFATRIIDIVDGKIVNDRENDIPEDLDYRLDNKIYLKDMDVKKRFISEDIKIDYYSDNKENLDINLVVRNGNIYIQSNTNKKVEVIDENSSMELVNSHYQKISKEEQEKCNFDLDSMVNKNQKLRYKSIYNIFSLTHYGFKKIFKYPFMKKILLLGFVISAMFVSYAIYNIFGITNIKEEKYITQEANDLELPLEKSSLDLYNKISNKENVNYVVPASAFRRFFISLGEYQQFYGEQNPVNFSIACKDILKQEDLIVGRLPENSREVVVDEVSLQRIISRFNTKNLGIFTPKDFIDLKIKVNNIYGKVKIVGIANRKSRCIYVAKEEIPSIVYYTNDANSNGGLESKLDLIEYNLIKDEVKIVEGKEPVNDYETILNIDEKEENKLNKEIDTTVNGKKLKVVGYYKPQRDYSEKLVNKNTINNKVIEDAKKYTINSSDKQNTIEKLSEEKINAIDIYEKDRTKYIEEIKKTIITTLISAGVVLGISLIEIYLMMRSSFLSRVKEIGILRAIGVKKKDIRKRFLGEIIAITIIASMPGYIIMTYIMNSLNTLPVFDEKYLVNTTSAILSLIIIVGANILIGTLPLFKILSKTPAEILSRTDVDYQKF